MNKPKKVMPAAPRATSSKPFTDPRRLLPGHHTSSDRICWRFAHVDNEGPWGLSRLGPAELGALFACMVKFETMTMMELFCRGEEPGKDYDVATLPTKGALDRLEALKLSDMTEISRLRIGGAGRLYGFRIANVFHVLWWDPKHEIWPSKKRNS